MNAHKSEADNMFKQLNIKIGILKNGQYGLEFGRYLKKRMRRLLYIYLYKVVVTFAEALF